MTVILPSNSTCNGSVTKVLSPSERPCKVGVPETRPRIRLPARICFADSPTPPLHDNDFFNEKVSANMDTTPMNKKGVSIQNAPVQDLLGACFEQQLTHECEDNRSSVYTTAASTGDPTQGSYLRTPRLRPLSQFQLQAAKAHQLAVERPGLQRSSSDKWPRFAGKNLEWKSESSQDLHGCQTIARCAQHAAFGDGSEVMPVSHEVLGLLPEEKQILDFELQLQWEEKFCKQHNCILS